MDSLASSGVYYLKQAQIFFGRPVTRKEFDEALPATRVGYVFTNWIKGKDYDQIPSITHVWQFIFYYNQYLRLSDESITPFQYRLTQVAMISGVGLNMIRAWTLLGPLLTVEETNSDGSIKEGTQKSWDRKLLEACYWVFSVVIVSRFAKDCGLIENAWERLFEMADVVCVMGVGFARAYQYYTSDSKKYSIPPLERVSVYASMIAAVLQPIALLQSHRYIRLIDQPLLNKINLVVTVTLAFAITAGHFCNKLYVNPDVIPETQK